MEKCTFCVQRIEEAKIAQRVKAGPSPDVRVPADAFQVACQQACPAEAIVFGDILEDPAARSPSSRKTRAVTGFWITSTSIPASPISPKSGIRTCSMPGAEKIATFDAAQEEKPKEEKSKATMEPKGAS